MSNLFKYLREICNESKPYFQMEITSPMNLPQKTKGEPKTVYSGGIDRVHEKICQQRKEGCPHRQTKQKFVKFTSKTKIKRIFIYQIHNDINIQTSQGHILYQIKVLL